MTKTFSCVTKGSLCIDGNSTFRRVCFRFVTSFFECSWTLGLTIFLRSCCVSMRDRLVVPLVDIVTQPFVCRAIFDRLVLCDRSLLITQSFGRERLRDEPSERLRNWEAAVDYQSLFGEGTRAVDTRGRRKSSLTANSLGIGELTLFFNPGWVQLHVCYTAIQFLICWVTIHIDLLTLSFQRS